MKSQILILCGLLFLSACKNTDTYYPDLSINKTETLDIQSNDSSLVNLFKWAINSSNKYVGDKNDPVGPWYEAALPAREAFCMRDVSHQCIGEEINGHGEENYNMMRKFVENISADKDYCSYWEINKDNLPAPVDYESDKDFWYNLNANFDVLQACYKLYKWTGNKQYLDNPVFNHFYQLSLHEYMDIWQLNVNEIMNRPTVMNEDSSLKTYRFKGVRGLPSYEESVNGLSVTGDLIAAIYKGLLDYANMLSLKGENQLAKEYRNKAREYAELYHTTWWNEKSQNYYAYKIDGELIEGGTNSFPLWFNIIDQPERINRLLSILVVKGTNVENMSYYPMLFYRNNLNQEGYNSLNLLYQNERRDYPEVASGIIEGVVSGLAGVDADASIWRISTLPRLNKNEQWIALRNISVFDGTISLIHYSKHNSSFINHTSKEITWRAMFPGDLSSINGEIANHTEDIFGNPFSYIDISCPVGKVMTAKASK